MQSPFTTALQLFRGGNAVAAAQLCRHVLTMEADHSEAAHLLGVIRLQEGATQEALELLSRAVVSSPNTPDFHIDLAEAYRANGQSLRSVGCCRIALRLRGNNAAAFNTLGLALLDLSRLSEAADAFRQAIELRPEFAAAHNNRGVALQNLNQIDDALEHFRRAVELAPDFAPGRVNLGRLLLALGRPEEALPHCEAAARLQSNSSDPQTDLANVLWALGRLRDARAGYLDAIRLAPDRPVPHANLGRLLRVEGRFGEAVVWLKAATELDPENATFWDELGSLHWEIDEAPAAMQCWERALVLDPRRSETRNALGLAFQEEGRHQEAGECYRIALELQPDLAPAHLNRGVWLEEQGDLAEAEAAYREAIRLQPTDALAHARLATLLRAKLPDGDLAALNSCLVTPRLDNAQRARLLFGLAHVWDARGDTAQAADCLRQANSLNLTADRARKRSYDPAEHERFVDSLIEQFQSSWFTRSKGAGSASRRPVFVIGLPRSGTTLVEQILASHPAVYGAGELVLGRRSFEAVPTFLGRSESPLQCLESLDQATIKRLAEWYLDQLKPLAPDHAQRVVDKMTENYLYLGWLATLFPNAVFVHCRRDLRDTALSCWMTDFRTVHWASDKHAIASRFRAYQRLMKHWQAACPVLIHEVSYEQIVANLETAARRLVSVCGLEWDPNCLAFDQNKRTVRTASQSQVRQPIYNTSVERWKRYEHELGDLFSLLPVDESAENAS